MWRTGELIKPIPVPRKDVVHIILEVIGLDDIQNIFMILLSENGTLISDFCLFISANALFYIPCCVLLNVVYS